MCGINWQKLSEPPKSTMRFYESIAFAQFDWYDGMCDDNQFIGIIGLIFDCAWEVANPGFSVTDACNFTPAVL